ncbi:MAG: hypothetical protein P8172_08565 [Gammaproteobacteria bacterium]|jgi:hypothetical protein
MKNVTTRIFVAGVLSCLALSAAAETIYEEVWTCTLEEGKNLEDVQAANSEWLASVNDKTGKGKIRSSVLRAVVGDTGTFYFVDTYPDLATWSATKEYLGTDEGQSVEEVFEGLSECSQNRLYRRDYTE